ncbi:MAG: hypothetical protein Athens101428_628 [Candidatus Berkelbacteria bacterium Athens1014_28]|uniref:GxxExxY protein n=1 Tax=Candidatus Berkelbacteria bacterium Athens1014_28 TaxID=2017145 RepID=A0A554LL55_9BACT|nr:MAG: hypothetical protein Athens101428_628 [Candidatus Berkelbacteria bacterium Athens1014_28]
MNKYQDDKKYPHSKITEKIINLTFKVFNELGYGLAEKIYQRALAIELENSKIIFKRECYGAISYNGSTIGKYFLDFLIDGKVAVELKVRNEIYKSHVSQLLNYLKSRNLQIGLLLVISKDGVKIKRLINKISDYQRNKSE